MTLFNSTYRSPTQAIGWNYIVVVSYIIMKQECSLAAHHIKGNIFDTCVSHPLLTVTYCGA